MYINYAYAQTNVFLVETFQETSLYKKGGRYRTAFNYIICSMIILRQISECVCRFGCQDARNRHLWQDCLQKSDNFEYRRYD